MRRVLPVVLLSLVPVVAAAQTWESYIIGNTVVPMLASGKGRGHGGNAPSPSPAPSPASAQSFSGDPGRAESGFTFPQYRVQTEVPDAPPITIQPIPPGQPGTGCCAPYATLTIPVQLLQSSQLPPHVSTQPVPRLQRECPTGCVQVPEPKPTPQSSPQPYIRQQVCNAIGQCIPWP
jgi:hypothetical protein